jgi:hypothetical protein
MTIGTGICTSIMGQLREGENGKTIENNIHSIKANLGPILGKWKEKKG